MLKATTSRFQHVDSQLVSIKSKQQGTRTEISFGFGSILLQLKMIHAIGKRLLNNLIPFSQTVLDCLRRNTSTNMEIYAFLLKIQKKMPNRMLLPAQDVVHFEDVLGRTKDLPYAYFHHWDVFESMLRSEFRGLPGEGKVLAGDHILMNSVIHGLESDKDAWERSVFPGTKLKMSVIMKALRANDRSSCLRPGCSGVATLS